LIEYSFSIDVQKYHSGLVTPSRKSKTGNRKILRLTIEHNIKVDSWLCCL